MSDDQSNTLPEGDFGTNVDEVLDGLKEMEGSYVFNCGYCEEVFETIVEWGLHSLELHEGQWPSMYPVRKQ